MAPKIPAAALPPVAAEAVPVLVALLELEPPELLELELDPPPHACRIRAPIPAAPPVSAVRRVICRNFLKGVSSSLRSSHSSRSIASWTTSSSLDSFCSSSPGLQTPQPSQTGRPKSNHINRG